MLLSGEEFEARLRTVITERISGCDDLVSYERLSGGASQETWRFDAEISASHYRTLTLLCGQWPC